MFLSGVARGAVVQSIFQAVEQGDTIALRALLTAHPRYANIRNETGLTPLHRASNAEMVRVLIEHGASVKARDLAGNTALHAAGLTEVAVVLIEHGASMDATNYAGQAPDETGHPEVSMVIAMMREELAVEHCAHIEFRQRADRALVMG